MISKSAISRPWMGEFSSNLVRWCRMTPCNRKLWMVRGYCELTQGVNPGHERGLGFVLGKRGTLVAFITAAMGTICSTTLLVGTRQTGLLTPGLYGTVETGLPVLWMGGAV